MSSSLASSPSNTGPLWERSVEELDIRTLHPKHYSDNNKEIL
jgi:hypothetical protein